jgi:hypothetical protein
MAHIRLNGRSPEDREIHFGRPASRSSLGGVILFSGLRRQIQRVPELGDRATAMAASRAGWIMPWRADYR